MDEIEADRMIAVARRNHNYDRPAEPAEHAVAAAKPKGEDKWALTIEFRDGLSSYQLNSARARAEAALKQLLLTGDPVPGQWQWSEGWQLWWLAIPGDEKRAE
jgi:hypothetical protein